MTVEPYVCPLDPETKTTLKLYLYTNVKNVEEIRNNVVKGVWNCAVIKPNLILDPFQYPVRTIFKVKSKHDNNIIICTQSEQLDMYFLTVVRENDKVIVAANKAVVAQTSGAMVTRTVYSEILYNLSLTKNIIQSLTRFGIDTGRDLLVCFLITSENDNIDHVLEHIDGEMCPISNLRNFTNVNEIKNVYKLNKVVIKSDYDLLDNIVSRIVTKNFISF